MTFKEFRIAKNPTAAIRGPFLSVTLPIAETWDELQSLGATPQVCSMMFHQRFTIPAKRDLIGPSAARSVEQPNNPGTGGTCSSGS